MLISNQARKFELGEPSRADAEIMVGKVTGAPATEWAADPQVWRASTTASWGPERESSPAPASVFISSAPLQGVVAFGTPSWMGDEQRGSIVRVAALEDP